MMMKKISVLGIAVFLLISCYSQTIKINIYFDHLSGLAPDDRVLFENNAAGTVDSIHYNKDGTYEVCLHIDKGFVHAATEHTRFKIVDDTTHSGHKAIAMVLLRQDGVPLSDDAIVRGDNPIETLGDHLNERIEEGFTFLKKQMERFAGDMKQVPNNDAYRNLKRSLSDLADAIGRNETQARKKLKEEWLPRLERELEELERQLREYGREKEAAPLKEEINRIRKI